MGKFRKKPVEISAWLIEDVLWEYRNGTLPDELVSAHAEGKISFADNAININTLEGTMKGRPGSFLIKGVEGEFYPCDPGIFNKTYDIVEEAIKAQEYRKKKHDGPCWRQSTIDCGC